MDMVVPAVRRACILHGEVGTALLKRVWENTRVWSGDGARRAVGKAATAEFPNMQFAMWVELHSTELAIKRGRGCQPRGGPCE